MSGFHKAKNEFRDELHARSARTAIPRLQVLLNRDRPTTRYALRWAAAGILVVTLASVPFYRGTRERARQEQERADARLWEQVDASLSRSAPRAFDALLMPGN